MTAWESHGYALSSLGRDDEAAAAFQKALAREPGRESALVGAAYLAVKMNRRKDAAAYWQRAIAINPWRSDYHQVVALLHSERQEWNAAIEASRDSLRLNPSNHEARMVLIQCLIRNRRLPEARREFQTLLDHDPPGRDALQAWFAKSVSP